MPRKRAKKRPRSGGRLLKQKAARRAPSRAKTKPRVVYRDTSGKFAKRSARAKQGVQLIGKKGVYAKPKRRNLRDVAEAIGEELLGSSKTYTSHTTSGTMADRVLEAHNGTEYIANAFARGRQSGVVSVSSSSDDLAFVVFFPKMDLQEMLAEVLTAYFQRAHAVRERVSAKSRAGKGSHRKYSLVRVVEVVIKLD